MSPLQSKQTLVAWGVFLLVLLLLLIATLLISGLLGNLVNHSHHLHLHLFLAFPLVFVFLATLSPRIVPYCQHTPSSSHCPYLFVLGYILNAFLRSPQLAECLTW